MRVVPRSRRIGLLALCAGLITCLLACKADVPSGVFVCVTDDDCPSAQRCMTSAEDNGKRCVSSQGYDEMCGADLSVRGYTGTAVWTTLDVSLCDILCPSHSPICIEDSCTHGEELSECATDKLFECSVESGGGCRSQWVDFGCCGHANCPNLSGDAASACRKNYCEAELTAASDCVYSDEGCVDDAWSECVAMARSGSAIDSGVRLDGGTDAGTKLDAAVAPRADAGMDSGVRDSGPPVGGPDSARPALEAGAGDSGKITLPPDADAAD
jgi:hypothetical protein